MNKFMRRALSAVVSIAVMFSVMVPLAPAFAADNQVTINILHTNDVHGAGIKEASKSMLRYSQIKSIKDSMENVLLFDAGDAIDGTVYATMTDGLSNINAMRLAGYDGIILGNHEFNASREYYLQAYTGAAGTNWYDDQTLQGDPLTLINSNVKWDSTKGDSLLDDASQYKIYEVDGVKVGVFGIVTPATQTVANPAELVGVTFANCVDTAAKMVAALKSEGADIIVCLAHCGYDESDADANGITSNAIAANVNGIDLIIDGHAHQSLMGSEAKVVNNTTIVSTGTALAALGKVEVTFDKDTNTVDITSSAITAEAASATAEDATVKAYLDGVLTYVDTATSEVVGYTSMGLYGGNYTNAGTTASIARRGETNVNSLIADARKQACEEYFANNATYKDMPVVALTCGGGVRNTIDAGDITYKEVLSLFLSGGTGGGTYVEIKGSLLWEIIEWGLSSITVQDPETGAISANGSYHGRFPNFAGVNYTYDLSQPGSCWKNASGEESLDWNADGFDTYSMGFRVQSVTLSDGTVITKDSDVKLILVTSDYEMGGGDGYGMLARAENAGELKEIGTGISSFEATIALIKSLTASKGDCYYPLNSGRVTNVANVYTKSSFNSVISVTTDGTAPLANTKVKLMVNYGTADGVKWEEVGSYTTDENGQFTVSLENGPQELKVVAADGTASDIKYVDNYAGLINSSHILAVTAGGNEGDGDGDGDGSGSGETNPPKEDDKETEKSPETGGVSVAPMGAGVAALIGLTVLVVAKKEKYIK